jgi:MerR family mercuric resistance operon transcriptional regulator
MQAEADHVVAIGEASRLSGVAIETIRYYEREGIISRAGRTPAGRRVYSGAEIAELRFIKRCRDLGFSVRDAVALRGLAAEPEGACETVERLGRAHLSEVRARISELRRLEDALAELVSNCSNGRRDCPMLDELRRG